MLQALSVFKYAEAINLQDSLFAKEFLRIDKNLWLMIIVYLLTEETLKFDDKSIQAMDSLIDFLFFTKSSI